MKVKANIPKLNQRYYNPFKEKGIYPFNKIGRVLIDKDTAEILMYLGENDSTLSKAGAPWIYDETRHDIAVYFPKFYSKRNWNQEELSDSFITEIPVNHVEQIPEYIKRKGFEIFPEFVREDGSVRPYILIGATKGVSLNNQLRSIIGYNPTVNKTLQEFLNESRFGRNNNWNIETIGIVSMIQFLYKIAFQDLDSQKTIGLGYSNRTELGLTGSTIKLGNHTGSLDPFANSPDKPHDSISMSFQCVDGELVIYNKKNSDPMPIKTTNMAGLQKWEETEDYIIYLCKDATMTTVQNYVTGTFQTFQERISDIESSQELLRSYSIEWSTQDSIDLINEINNEALAKLEATPMLLAENGDNKIQVLSAKAVPVTYDCCFRMDKKTGEFYIGEGYENIVRATVNGGIEIQKIQDGLFKLVATRTSNSSAMWYRGLESNTNYSYYWNTVKNVGNFLRVRTPDNTFVNSFYSTDSLGETTMRTVETKPQFDLVYELGEGEIGREVEVKMQLTKTSTPKPFVKSVMPSGKLAFVTNATSETHSFVMKGGNGTIDNTWIMTLGATPEDAELLRSLYDFNNTLTKVDMLYSRNYKENLDNPLKNPNYNKGGIVLTSTTGARRFNSFTQLLIYKANLTETELKAELTKDIKLKHFEYKEENSNLYYTDLFKSHSLGQIGICILNSNYTSLNFGGIFAADFSEIETFKNNLTGARVCYYP